MTVRTTRQVFAALALAGLLAACSSGNKSTTNTTTTKAGTSATTAGGGTATGGLTVSATDSNQFSPDTLTVAVGQTVTWKNDGSAPHTVTFDNGTAFDKALDPGGEVSRTFDTKGTFKYHCTIHGQSMSGEITVA